MVCFMIFFDDAECVEQIKRDCQFYWSGLSSMTAVFPGKVGWSCLGRAQLRFVLGGTVLALVTVIVPGQRWFFIGAFTSGSESTADTGSRLTRGRTPRPAPDLSFPRRHGRWGVFPLMPLRVGIQHATIEPLERFRWSRVLRFHVNKHHSVGGAAYRDAPKISCKPLIASDGCQRKGNRAQVTHLKLSFKNGTIAWCAKLRSYEHQ
jgi:hypothetical protein